MHIANTSDVAVQENAPRKTNDPDKVRDAAQQFEALLIGQMLKGARESGTSWLGTEADAASESAVEMAEQEFAKALSSQGGFGVARLVEAGLRSDQHPGVGRPVKN